MPKTSNNVVMVQQDDDGLFIRMGTNKYRPPSDALIGVTKGKTVKAWPWPGGMKVETGKGANVWPKHS